MKLTFGALLIVGAILDCGISSARASLMEPLNCIYKERKSDAQHVLWCEVVGGNQCPLSGGLSLENILSRFTTAKIVKMGPMPDGCLRLTIIGHLKSLD